MQKPAHALFIKTDGTVKEITPNDNKAFSLEELQNLIGYMSEDGRWHKTVQWVPFPSGKVLICNDDGRLIGCPPNARAMQIWAEEYPKSKFPENNDGLVVGNVLISPKTFIR